MDLEEHTIEELKERCERCGTQLTDGEMAAAMESAEPLFLCAACSAEELPSNDEELEG